MDGDVGAAQETVKLLNTEPGLTYIKNVTDKHLQASHDDGERLSLWNTQIQPLFQLLTHPLVVDSAVLEQEVAALFNFLLGVGGSRMTRLCSYITRLVDSWPATSSTTSPSRMATVELTLSVLSKSLDYNTTSILNDSLRPSLSRLSDVVSQDSRPDEEFYQLQAAKYLEYINRRLEVGDEIPEFDFTPVATVARETFVLRRDLPGHLSADGPRHDNDHADITKIAIMPTYQETVSPRAEYLPSNDSSHWHIPGIRGRLDREFRLLREDTVGQLRDAVRDILTLIRNPSEGQSGRLKNAVRTYTYDYPTPVSVDFDAFAGMELLVSCHQPTPVQTLSLKKRHDWWTQSKRLQAGALVCILDATGSMMFFVVSDSTMRTRDDEKNRKTISTLR